MNSVTLIGRLTKDPWVNGSGDKLIAKYTLAVQRRGKENEADFISCVTFGKGADFAEKYLHKGSKIAVNGRLQTGKYTNKDGQTVYKTDVIVQDHEFCESRGADETTEQENKDSGFADVSDAMSELPFA